MIPSFARTALALAALGTLGALPASAQCGTPDNLDGGPCCAPAAVNLPSFPQLANLDALWICFDNCGPALQRPFCATLGKPQPVQFAGALACGEFNARIQLKDCGTNLLHWSGGLRLTYSRTWLESPIPGAVPLQVWRFIVNGDLIPTQNVPNNPLERPASLQQYARVYFSGHIDYALDCGTNAWSVAWSLNHECDQVHHSPNSVRPAPTSGFDPAKSFSIVGPGIGFVPAPVNTLVSDGPIVQGSMRRNNWSSSASLCTFREPISGNVVAQNLYCLCSNISPAPPQSVDTFVGASGNCGSALSPAPGIRFTQKRIGTWTNPGVFPGVEDLLFDFGGLRWADACTGTQSIEWYEGVETIGGFLAIDAAGLALGQQFEDWGSCNTAPNNPATRIGAPHVTFSIVNMNLP